MSKADLTIQQILNRQPPSVAEAIPTALRRGAMGFGLGACLAAGFFAIPTLWHAARGDGLQLPAWWRIAIGMGIAGFAVSLLFVVCTMLASSRRFLDKSFSWFAMGVTSIGFAMLLWFMGSLMIESAHWFTVMKGKVIAENEELQRKIIELEGEVQLKEAEVLSQMRAELDQETDPEARKSIEADYREKILPQRLADIKKSIPEKRYIWEKQMRPVPSNWALLKHFLTSGPSSEKTPQDAGILPALIGSLLIGIVTVLFSVPLGVGAAIYLEEYRAKGWLNKIIQINITNLAAVPSVFYGILGAYIFVELIFKNLQGEMWTPSLLSFTFGQERAEAFMHAVFGEKIAARNLLGGGLSLALLTLPVVIVAAQEAIRAVPQSLRHAALALGATKWQSIWHHVIPQARSGILTGVILALSRAIGEAAPLVMFGALTLVTYNPRLLTPFTVMPLQIFNWSGRSVEEWKFNAALASLILMVLLLVLNGAAIWLRQRARRSLKAA